MTAMETGHRHHGLLHLRPSDAGLRAVFEITDQRVSISIEHGEQFAYEPDDVQASSFDSRTVLLEIAGDNPIYFSADDPLDFAARVLPTLRSGPDGSRGRTKSRSGRWRLPVIGSHSASDGSGTTRTPVPPRKGKPRSRGECVHEWRSLRLGGGLVRHVCNACGRVSIDLTEA